MPKLYRIIRRIKDWQQYIKDRTAQDTNGCWIWQGATIGPRHEYGYCGYGGKTSVLAHRASFLIFNGEIPDNLCVLHTCDVALCCNPKHLFLGTKADNNKDRFAKGRYKTKLSEAQVLEIRAALGITQKALAIKYGVSQVYINQIVNHKRKQNNG